MSWKIVCKIRTLELSISLLSQHFFNVSNPNCVTGHHPKIMRIYFSFAFQLLFFYPAFSQNKIFGTVSDLAGEPLVFVTILPDGDPARGLLSDIEGKFFISEKTSFRSLTFRYVGFETLVLDTDFFSKNRDKPLKINLKPADFGLPEITVRPGENFAETLIRRAVAHRNQNNPERQPAFRCTTYNKVILDGNPHRDEFENWLAGRDSTKKRVQNVVRNFKNSEARHEEKHVLIMETVTDRAFRFPDQNTERVLLNRVSGFEKSGMAALANAVQPFSFYSDFIRVLDKNFVNPISPGSTDLYFFNLEDTLFSGRDTIWVVSFQPRRGKVFEAMTGVLHLSSKGWAVQNVRAAPSFEGSNLDMKIEQQYQFVQDSQNGFWFPEQLNFELEFKKYPSPMFGLRATGKSFISGAHVFSGLPTKIFDPEKPIFFEKNAETRADSAWQKWHELHPLSRKEIQTYRFLDSLGKHEKFDNMAAAMRILGTGLLPIRNGISLDISQILTFNDFEKARLEVNLTTAQSNPNLQPKRWESGIYAGFGIGDEKWKQGFYTLVRLARGSQTQLKFDLKNDLLEPGALHELPRGSLFNRNFYAQKMDWERSAALKFSTRLGKFFQTEITARRQEIEPKYAYRFGDDDQNLTSKFQFSESTVFLRFAFGEKQTRFLGEPMDRTQRFPAVELAWSRGWKNILGGQFGYDRFVAVVHQSVFVRRLGRMKLRLEFGKVVGDAPLPKLFTQNQGGGGGFSFFFVPNTFQSLPDTLWLADRFFNGYFSQQIGHVFYKKKWSAPWLTLLQNMAWTDLEKPERHRDLQFLVARKPIFESGIQLDNLLKINNVNFMYFGLGGAVFYRWGGFSDKDFLKNVVPKLTIRVSL